MNQLALSDSVTTYRDKSGDLTFEKSTLIASKNELKNLNRELYDEVKDLKDNPKIVIKTEVKIIHDTVEVETKTILYADGSIGLNWNRDTTFSVGNFQSLSGETRFKLDSNKVTNVNTTLTKNTFGMSFITGLKEGKDSYEIFIKSDYPGFSATDIQGSIIDKKMIQSNESSFVFGPSIGYGLVLNPSGNASHGFMFGVTATYNLNKPIKKLFRPFGL